MRRRIHVLGTAKQLENRPDYRGGPLLGRCSQPRRQGSFATDLNGVAGFVDVIDTSSNTVTSQISVGNAPWSVAASPDGTRIYVAVDVVQFAKFNTALYLAPKLSAFASVETFTLGARSTGVSPTTQPVTLKIGALSIRLPAGLRLPRQGDWRQSVRLHHHLRPTCCSR
jgi:YVTN family beta-propeller protein